MAKVYGQYPRIRMYTVKLAVYGIKEEYDPRAVHDIENELGMRSHIHKKLRSGKRSFPALLFKSPLKELIRVI